MGLIVLYAMHVKCMAVLYRYTFSLPSKESGRMAKKKTKEEVAVTVSDAEVEAQAREVEGSEVLSGDASERGVSASEVSEAGDNLAGDGAEPGDVVAMAEQDVFPSELGDASSEPEIGQDAGKEVQPHEFVTGELAVASDEEDAGDGEKALHDTGRIHQDEAFNDEHALTRLRGSLLSVSDLYREAQVFGAHQFDVDELLSSLEMPLVQNVVSILNLRDEFYPSELKLFSIDDEALQEVVCRNVISKVRRNIAPYMEVAELVSEAASENRLNSAYLSFVEKFVSSLRAMIVQQTADMSSQMNALTRVCACIPDDMLSRVLFDPSPLIRAAVIRGYASRGGVSMNDLTVILIMLKDHSEIVDSAIMRILAKFTPAAELAIPPVLETLSAASEALRNEIYDVFRSYGNEAVAPVMMGLEDVRDSVYFAVRNVIARAPQRYTSALLERLESVRTRDYVRERVASILSDHKDETRRDEIAELVDRYKSAKGEEKPEWHAPDTGSPKFATPATDKHEVYEGLMSEAAIEAFSPECTHEMLRQLLNDASETARINALHLVRYRGSAEPDIRGLIRVWLKTTSLPLAFAAMEAYLKVETDVSVVMGAISDVLVSGPSDDVKDMIFDEISKHQETVDGIIESYYEEPRKLVAFVHRLLRHNPTDETFRHVLGGLDRERSVQCIFETLSVLLKTGYIFDNLPLRPVLVALVEEPVSKGQFGLMTRILSLRLLRRYMRDQADPDSVAALQRIYKENRNIEIRELAKDILQDAGEELFDLDDEFDDFEDLNDDEDDD